jgi:hypothetical protein
VLPLELDHLLERADLARVEVDPLDDEELPANLGRFRVL